MRGWITERCSILFLLCIRMTDWQQAGTNAFAEKDITYDANGNILTMRRYGADASLESDYSYAYSGNRLMGLTDGYLSTSSFGYDANGNLISDSRSGITSVTYNVLNLPQEMNGGEVKYVYLSDGAKLAVVKDGSGLVYCGSMVYSGTFSAVSTSDEFESTEFSAGRLVKKSGSVSPEYHVNDYLCSVRVVTDSDGEVLERNDYSGYGKRLSSSVVSSAGVVANRYRFGGKEEQSPVGIGWLDFGARMYDADLARWTTPDPLAYQYPGISPYVYCAGDPVNFVDPEGLTPILYIQKSGLGHVFVTTGEGINTTVYTYGRYGALNETSGSNSGRFTPKGEGVLLRLTSDSAIQYLGDVLEEGNLDIFQINDAVKYNA